jgi:hypothetical protein
MATNTLLKINRRAKQIRKAHPGKSWKAAQKQAGKEIGKGRVGSTRTKKRKTVGKVARHKSRIGDNAKYKCVHEVRRVGGITYKGGSIRLAGMGSVDAQKARLKATLGQQAGWLEVAISSAKTQREKNALRKKKREIISEMNRIK